jgi:NitT/TauT family transport system substrate-binding protein
VSALSEAEVFIAKNPERTRALLRQRLSIDPDWSLYRFDLQLTQDQLVFMERQARWAIRNNLVMKKEMPNLLDFFYFNAVDKVKPEAVSIVH